MDETTPFRPVLRTQVQLEAAWRHLMGPYSFSGRTVWLLMITSDDRPVPHLAEFAELPEVPDGMLVAGLTRVLAAAVEEAEPARLAFLLSRPGHDGVRPADRAWARALLDVAAALGTRGDVVHLATDRGVMPLPLDDLDGLDGLDERTA